MGDGGANFIPGDGSCRLFPEAISPPVHRKPGPRADGKPMSDDYGAIARRASNGGS